MGQYDLFETLKWVNLTHSLTAYYMAPQQKKNPHSDLFGFCDSLYK